jgi:hypothetical protein
MRMYVIGEAYYFVLGGNHRLSVVTRCQGTESKEEGRDR